MTAWCWLGLWGPLGIREWWVDLIFDGLPDLICAANHVKITASTVKFYWNKMSKTYLGRIYPKITSGHKELTWKIKTLLRNKCENSNPFDQLSKVFWLPINSLLEMQWRQRVCKLYQEAGANHFLDINWSPVYCHALNQGRLKAR